VWLLEIGNESERANHSLPFMLRRNMRFSRFAILSLLLFVVIDAEAVQRGIRGQVFLPNGSPVERTTRFALSYENGLRQEYHYTDSHGRIAIQQDINTPYTITVESDDQTYDTTRITFYPPSSGNYIVVNLRPLPVAKPPQAGVVDASSLEQKISPRALEAYNSAIKHLQAAEYRPAIDLLQQAVAIQPDYFNAHNDLGVAYLKTNQVDQAVEAFRRAIKINDKVYLPQLNLGIILNRQRKYAEAAELLGKLQRKHPDITAIHAPLIEALIEAKLWREAEAELRLAPAIQGFDPVDLKTKLGVVLIRQEKYAEAVAVLREAVGLNPDSPLACFNLGAALHQTGELDDAEKYLRRAYELRPTRMAGAQLVLGQVYHQKKDYPKAIEAFEIYLRDAPEAPNRDQVTEAIRRLREALARK
jgi:tetratricopeptide (TPR) repeat protein